MSDKGRYDKPMGEEADLDHLGRSVTVSMMTETECASQSCGQ